MLGKRQIARTVNNNRQINGYEEIDSVISHADCVFL